MSEIDQSLVDTDDVFGYFETMVQAASGVSLDVPADRASTLETPQRHHREKPQSLISDVLRQLGRGTDLSAVTLPVFVLEPRSLLERIADFMSHPDLILSLHIESDGTRRFLSVVQYFLSSWYIRPKGAKKPYNPVLGEFFKCSWDVPGSGESCTECGPSRCYYFSEQVSHHPPISAYFYCNPRHQLVIQGNFRPKSKFLGNSAVSLLHGSSSIYTVNRPDEIYTLTNPNMYVRGLFMGKVLTELGDTVKIECRQTRLYADIDFKVKGYFLGDYDTISGRIRRIADVRAGPNPRRDQVVFVLSGKWTDRIYRSQESSAEPVLLLDTGTMRTVSRSTANSDQRFESRNMWSRVTRAIRQRKLDRARQEKALVEDHQRARTGILRESQSRLATEPCRAKIEKSEFAGMQFGPDGIPLTTRYFVSIDGIEWAWKWLDRNLEEICEQLLNSNDDTFMGLLNDLLSSATE